MHPRVRAVLLAGAALVALAPSSGAAALAGHGSAALSHTATDQPLTWSVVPSPGGQDSELLGVTCLSAMSCIAVGSGGPKTVVDSWNGTAWSVVPSPNRSGTSKLSGVSCVSASACTAVGTSAPSASSPQSKYRTLVESWNGTAWSIVPSPNPHKSQGYASNVNAFSGVSCAATDSCTVVGYYLVPGAEIVQPTLTESWDGTAWSIVPSPSPPKSANSLNGVSCPSATTCLAAGWRYDRATHGFYQTLAELGTSAG